jgi:hypothetical protein
MKLYLYPDPTYPVRLARPKGKKCRWPTFPTLYTKGNLKICFC